MRKSIPTSSAPVSAAEVSNAPESPVLPVQPLTQLAEPPLAPLLADGPRNAPDVVSEDDVEDSVSVRHGGRIILFCRTVPPQEWRARLRAYGFGDYVGDRKVWRAPASAAGYRLAQAASAEPWLREIVSLSS